ncbi:hypothetical protein C0J52_27652 [Blattella germanica]|nr:hypothetical protein C0J52_27652 [Blattella germanica]
MYEHSKMVDMNEIQVSRAVVLREQGWTYHQIAADLNFSVSVIYRAIKRHRETRLYKRRQGQGLVMPRQRDLPKLMAWRVIRRMDAGQTQQEVAQAIGVSQSVISFSRTDTVHSRAGQDRPWATTALCLHYLGEIENIRKAPCPDARTVLKNLSPYRKLNPGCRSETFRANQQLQDNKASLTRQISRRSDLLKVQSFCIHNNNWITDILAQQNPDYPDANHLDRFRRSIQSDEQVCLPRCSIKNRSYLSHNVPS